MEVLCGDIGDVYVNVYTTEKVYAVASPEFDSGLQGKLVILCEALYGLATSCAYFYDHLADTLHSMNFVPTRFYCNIWIRKLKDKKSYDFICTHVNDFSMFSENAKSVMDQIQKVYTVKLVGPLEYYLGNNFKKDSKGR
eukprot:6181797-Ditylum_brightwellii.AAC.1